jgi:hypothetical protein
MGSTTPDNEINSAYERLTAKRHPGRAREPVVWSQDAVEDLLTRFDRIATGMEQSERRVQQLHVVVDRHHQMISELREVTARMEGKLELVTKRLIEALLAPPD